MPGEKESAMNSSLGPFYHPVKTHPSLLLSMREAELVPGSPGLGHSLRIKNHSVASEFLFMWPLHLFPALCSLRVSHQKRFPSPHFILTS